MQRRELLKWGAGLLLGSGLGLRSYAGTAQRIVVVGGGILGASIAWHLVRRGADVTVLEKTQPAAGASGKSFAWINANISKQPRDYHLFSRLSVLAWHDLHQRLGDALPVRWDGTFEWYANPARAEELERVTAQQRAWGWSVRSLDALEFTRLAPQVQPGKIISAALTEIEGAVDSGAATRLLLDEAVRAGAKIVHPCEVQAIETSASGVQLRTTQGDYRADRVVLASGVQTEALAALVGAIPRSTPGLVVHAQPLRTAGASTTPVALPPAGRWSLRARRRLRSPHTRPHHLLENHPLDFPRESLSAKHGERIRGQAARYLPSLANVPIESVSLCWRPMPQDGYPILGYVGGDSRVYVTVTHSGVTLAPLIGELAALELLDGAQVDLMAPYRPARFVS